MMPSVLNSVSSVSVPNVTGVPNVTIVPNIPKMTKNDASMPKSYSECRRNDFFRLWALGVIGVSVTICAVGQKLRSTSQRCHASVWTTTPITQSVCKFGYLLQNGVGCWWTKMAVEHTSDIGVSCCMYGDYNCQLLFVVSSWNVTVLSLGLRVWVEFCVTL